MTKIANRDVREEVKACRAFKANNVFGERITPSLYVVYSYGHHFPMYVCLFGQWYANTDKYSVTTSKHQGQANPYVSNILPSNTGMLQKLIDNNRNS